MPAPALRRLLSRALIVIVVLGLLGVLAWRWLQPPLVPGYRIQTTDLVQNVVATGYVVTPSRVQVASEITGVVVKRLVDRGQTVRAGQPLLELRADQSRAQLDQAQAALRQLQQQTRPQAQAALQQAQAQLAHAQIELKRAQGLFETGGGSAQQLDQARTSERTAREQEAAARAALAAVAPGGAQERALQAAVQAARAVDARTLIRAGVDGTVLARNVEVGDTVNPGQTLFTLAMAGPTEVLLPVNEQSIAHLRLGQQATCIADAYPDRRFAAVLSFLAPQVDRSSGTLEVRLRVPDPPAWLKQDMTVSADIVTARAANTLVVPNDALLRPAGDRAEVLRVENGRVRQVPVQLGLRGLTLTQVTGGLQSGDVVLPAKAAAPGARVRVQLQPLPLAATASQPADAFTPLRQ